MKMDRLHNCVSEVKFRSQYSVVFQLFYFSLCTALKLKVATFFPKQKRYETHVNLTPKRLQSFHPHILPGGYTI